MNDRGGITVRLAVEEDIHLIMKMNKHWIADDINKIDKSYGYLNVDAFVYDDLMRIINNKEIVIALDGDVIAGYYLFDNFSNTAYLEKHKTVINTFMKEGVISKDKRISLRMQCVVDRSYQMNGLSKHMFSKLLLEVSSKYDLYFASVSIENPKYKAHINIGWEAFKKVDDLLLIVYKP